MKTRRANPTFALPPHDNFSPRFFSTFLLRQRTRKKNGKSHGYWSIVESRRLDGGRVAQRRVLYLGEINDSREAAWRKSIEVFDEDKAGSGRAVSGRSADLRR